MRLLSEESKLLELGKVWSAGTSNAFCDDDLEHSPFVVNEEKWKIIKVKMDCLASIKK